MLLEAQNGGLRMRDPTRRRPRRPRHVTRPRPATPPTARCLPGGGAPNEAVGHFVPASRRTRRWTSVGVGWFSPPALPGVGGAEREGGDGSQEEEAAEAVVLVSLRQAAPVVVELRPTGRPGLGPGGGAARREARSWVGAGCGCAGARAPSGPGPPAGRGCRDSGRARAAAALAPARPGSGGTRATRHDPIRPCAGRRLRGRDLDPTPTPTRPRLFLALQPPRASRFRVGPIRRPAAAGWGSLHRAPRESGAPEDGAAGAPARR